ncbi:MAG: amino acid adenylation domain-containing protein [Gammaproteobacteria bacterium]|nr:amino acid adenylation domain-containing protein [Gammaproteobacteria bacterium]
MHSLKSKKEKSKSYSRGSDIPIKQDLITVLLDHARTTPTRLAVVTSDTSWTYQALFEDVLLWKNRLCALDINTPVIICLHRTPRLISILFALQWLEIPYIPVEPKIPLERIRAIIEDSEAGILLHDTVYHEEYMSLPCKTWALNELEQTADVLPLVLKENVPHSNAIAYIIYTSGSTGTPKGVCVSRGALNNFLGSMSRYFLKGEKEVLLATTTLTFDIAALELYLPIWQQKTLFLANQEEHKDPLRIQQLLQSYPITLLQGTPSFWSMLHHAGWDGTKGLVALCGGEPLTNQIVQRISPKVASLWNMYGPTEATIWCSLKQIQSHTAITAGRPICNMEMWVLDASMQVVPAGTKGELYISGLGLAEGYMNRQALTKERFVSYKHAQGQRVYSTGDVACMTHDGEFVIFGRVDNQVKLHGYRIELEDIEAHIQSYPDVRECGVQVHQEQLIAYICTVKNSDYSELALLNQLGSELPEFMLPKRFIYLDNLPVNSSGKLNRHALPLPYYTMHHASEDVTPTEASLMGIWREVLNVFSMSTEDNFFDLGGHSLLAARIIMKVREDLGKMVTMADIYHAPSIAEFAELVTFAPDAEKKTVIPRKAGLSSWMPLTDFQFVLWMSNVFKPDVKKLNVVGRKRILGPLNRDALNLALQALIQKHDVLSYRVNRVIPVQKRRVEQAIQWHEDSILSEDEAVMEAHLSQSMDDLYVYQAWDKNKPLIHAKLFYLTKQRIEIQIVMPHMIADQQSLGIFFQDLSDAYLFYARQLTAEINLDSRGFETYVRHEHDFIRSSLKTDELFWKTYLKDAELIRFVDRYVVSNPAKQAHAYSTFLPIEEAQLKKWRAFCIKHAITLNDLLCAGVGAILHQNVQEVKSMPEHLFINVVKSTREDPVYDEVIGCFLRAQPIKLNLTGKKDMVALAKQVQQSALETAPHQYASSLIKLSSIGDLDHSAKWIKPFLISLLGMFSGNMRQQPYALSAPILNACKRLAVLEQRHGFVVNVNIWDSFFSSSKEKSARLFGAMCEPVPLEQKDIFTINDVLDICLLKDSAKNQAFLVLSANLQPEFREHLGRSLLDTLG